MPISPDHYQSLDDSINRLATESILAQVGRDEGLVPSYSLLGDLRELCAGDPLLAEPVVATQAALEKLLDTAKPFDEAMLTKLRALVEWLPLALARIKAGEPVLAFGTEAPAPQPAAATASEAIASNAPASADLMLDLNLGENRELLTEFYAETVDHLQQIEAALLALDQQPDNPDALAAIFRSFHTIKGNAGFLGLIPMHTLAHEVESLLDLARNDKLRLTAPIITEILRSRDALQTLTNQVGAALEKGQLPDQIVPVGHLIGAVKQLAANGGAVTTAPFAPIQAADAVAPRGSATTDASGNESNQGEPLPIDDELEIAPIIPLSPQPIASKPVAAESSPTPVKKTSAVNNAKAAGSSATVRVNTDKLDSLMDVVGELVIVQSQLVESSRQGSTDVATLQRNVAQLGRITKELQSTAMSLRMIPIKPTFQKMERLARDLARDFGKKVAFVTSGEDTELDRTVVEEIGDPLVHMVRNALDHGLESTADRIGAGKPETGQLHLRAYHQGSNIVIELQDDGRGIDPDRIYRKAVEKGVIAAGAQLSRDEILALIFAPGFSTAEKVTAVSGRGVGGIL